MTESLGFCTARSAGLSLNRERRDRMKDMAQRLLKITEGCRDDMHEPDE